MGRPHSLGEYKTVYCITISIVALRIYADKIMPSYLESFLSRHQNTLSVATASKATHIAKPAWIPAP